MFAALLLQAAVEDVDVEALLKVILEGVEKGNWWIVAGPVLALAIHFTKKLIAPKSPALSEFLNKPLVAFATPFVIAFLVGTVQTFIAVKGVPTSADFLALAASALKVGVTAVATYVGIKKGVEQKELAAEKAAAAVPDKQAAVDELNKP
jgi:uncharacterized membrane protein